MSVFNHLSIPLFVFFIPHSLAKQGDDALGLHPFVCVFVCLSVCALLLEPPNSPPDEGVALICLYICVSVIKGHVRIILRTRLIGF